MQTWLVGQDSNLRIAILTVSCRTILATHQHQTFKELKKQKPQEPFGAWGLEVVVS